MSNEDRVGFLGTYFDRDSVLRLAHFTNILSWVVAVVYGAQLVLSIGVFLLQILRGFMPGMGFTDYLQQILSMIEQPFRGIVYFAVLQAVSKTLLIFLDLEENTRLFTRNTKNKRVD